MPKQKSKKRAEERSITEYKDKVIPSVYKALCKGTVSREEVDLLLKVLEAEVETMSNSESEEPATVMYQRLWLKDRKNPPSHFTRLKSLTFELRMVMDGTDEYPGSLYRLHEKVKYLQWLANNSLKTVLRNKLRL